MMASAAAVLRVSLTTHTPQPVQDEEGEEERKYPFKFDVESQV